MRHTVAILIDERSMLSAEVLGAVERNVSMTCHGGNKYKLKWGGIPIVLLIGDDYQLPPVQVMGKGKGAFSAVGYQTNKRSTGISLEMKGIEEFIRISKGAFILTDNKRITQGQQEFKELLNRVRVGQPTEHDKATILSLSLLKQPRLIREQYEQSPDTIYLFATREMCSEHNFKKLKDNNTDDNPIAFLKHKLPKHMNVSQSDHNAIPQITCFSRGCKVSIKGRNFCPKLGLYNGAIGTVQEIVFKPGESPNTGDLPLYVAVDFPGYLGHKNEYGSYIWDMEHPTIIPIPMINTIDERTKKKYDILSVSFVICKDHTHIPGTVSRANQ